MFDALFLLLLNAWRLKVFVLNLLMEMFDVFLMRSPHAAAARSDFLCSLLRAPCFFSHTQQIKQNDEYKKQTKSPNTHNKTQKHTHKTQTT